MSLADGQLNADGSISWEIVKPAGNVIGVQELPIGSTDEWVDAPVIAQLPKTATSYTPTSTGVMVRVTQLQFEAGALKINVPIPAPPAPPTPPAPPAPTQYTVPATPSCPLPSGGVTLVMGWAANPADPLGQPTSIGAPSRNNDGGDGLTADEAPFNPNEDEVWRAQQVTLAGGKAVLTATYDPGSADINGTTYDYTYVSACISTQPAQPSGGQSGFPIKGFGFMPTKGVVTMIEFGGVVFNSQEGDDFGFWASTPDGGGEIDFFECANYVGGAPGQWQAMGAWYNHVTGTSAAGADILNPGWMRDGQPHTLTVKFDGNTELMSGYVDEQQAYSFSWLAEQYEGMPFLNLLLSYALRSAFAGQGPTFTGSASIPFDYIAAWQDTAHAGVGIQGGGIAPGTAVA